MNEIEKKVKAFRKAERIKGVPTFEQLKVYILKSGFQLNSYSESQDLIEKLRREKDMRDVPAFTAKTDDTYRVFYNERLNESDLIFALCHECGHICLNHLFKRRGAYDTSIHKEQEAFRFAVCLVDYPKRKKKNLKYLLSGILVGLFLCSFSVLAATIVPDKEPEPDLGTYNQTEFESLYNVTAPLDPNEPDPLLKSDYVAVTKWGAKYHLSSCPQIKSSKTVTKLTVSEAESAGYSPCKICIK